MGKEVVEQKQTVAAIEFLWLGLYAFAGFSLELIFQLLAGMVGFKEIPSGINSLITGVLWFLTCGLLIIYAQRRFSYNVFSVKSHLNHQKLIAIAVLILLVIIATFIGFGGFKPVIEYQSGAGKSILTYLLQVFYYLGESGVIVLAIVFGQEFCERQFSLSNNFPSGGLFLAVTWGIMHIFLQGLSGGLFTIFFSIVAGLIYVICKKDIRWSYLFIALAFIL